MGSVNQNQQKTKPQGAYWVRKHMSKSYRISIICLFVSIGFYSPFLTAQINPSDSTIERYKDSVLSRYLAEIYIDTMQQNYVTWENNYYNFQYRLKEKAYKSGFTKELYNLIFKNPGTAPDTLTRNEFKTVDPFLPHEGKTIRKIVIFKLEPFGPTLDDFTKEPDTWLAKTGNRIQVDTRDFVIRNNILFSEGDKIIPTHLADSERILRQLRFIRDAQITVIWSSEEEVILMIKTKDNWSMTAGINHYRNDSNAIQAYDRNIMGVGHMIKHELLIREQELGYNGFYKIENINGSFISGRAGYTSAFGYKDHYLNFDRPLLTRKMKYGGGLTFQQKHSLWLQPEHEDIKLKYNYYDVWLGKRVCIKPRKAKCPENVEFMASARYMNMFFLDRPETTIDQHFSFHHRDMFLFSFGFTQREYYSARLINYFGVTEDVPTGTKLELSLGYERREFYNRQYAGIRLQKSDYYKFGYLSGKFEWGSFFHKNDWEQGVISFTLSGFANGFSFGRSHYRPFFFVNYTSGINRNDNEYIDLNGHNGITALTGDTKGLHRLVFNHESVLFRTRSLAGFQFAYTSFINLGIIEQDGEFFCNPDFYCGLGLGLRVNNHNLFFENILIQFAYYPIVPPDGISTRFYITNSPEFEMDDLIMEEPEVLDFN